MPSVSCGDRQSSCANFFPYINKVEFSIIGSTATTKRFTHASVSISPSRLLKKSVASAAEA